MSDIEQLQWNPSNSNSEGKCKKAQVSGKFELSNFELSRFYWNTKKPLRSEHNRAKENNS